MFFCCLLILRWERQLVLYLQGTNPYHIPSINTEKEDDFPFPVWWDIFTMMFPRFIWMYHYLAISDEGSWPSVIFWPFPSPESRFAREELCDILKKLASLTKRKSSSPGISSHHHFEFGRFFLCFSGLDWSHVRCYMVTVVQSKEFVSLFRWGESSHQQLVKLTWELQESYDGFFIGKGRFRIQKKKEMVLIDKIRPIYWFLVVYSMFMLWFGWGFIHPRFGFKMLPQKPVGRIFFFKSSKPWWHISDLSWIFGIPTIPSNDNKQLPW